MQISKINIVESITFINESPKRFSFKLQFIDDLEHYQTESPIYGHI